VFRLLYCSRLSALGLLFGEIGFEGGQFLRHNERPVGFRRWRRRQRPGAGFAFNPARPCRFIWSLIKALCPASFVHWRHEPCRPWLGIADARVRRRLVNGVGFRWPSSSIRSLQINTV